MNIDELIALAQAEKEGKTLQYKHQSAPFAYWNDCVGSIANLSLIGYDWRIKKEPERVWQYKYSYDGGKTSYTIVYDEAFIKKNNPRCGPYFVSRRSFIAEDFKE